MERVQLQILMDLRRVQLPLKLNLVHVVAVATFHKFHFSFFWFCTFISNIYFFALIWLFLSSFRYYICVNYPIFGVGEKYDTLRILKAQQKQQMPKASKQQARGARPSAAAKSR